MRRIAVLAGRPLLLRQWRWWPWNDDSVGNARRQPRHAQPTSSSSSRQNAGSTPGYELKRKAFGILGLESASRREFAASLLSCRRPNGVPLLLPPRLRDPVDCSAPQEAITTKIIQPSKTKSSK